jgi:hypothetical protein
LQVFSEPNVAIERHGFQHDFKLGALELKRDCHSCYLALVDPLSQFFTELSYLFSELLQSDQGSEG